MDRIAKPWHEYMMEVHEILSNDNDVKVKEIYIGPGGTTGGGRWIREETVIDVNNGRNLLQLSILHFGMRLLRMFMKAPYSWDPDKSDHDGGSAMRLAVDRDDIEQLGILAPFSRELGYIRNDEREPKILNCATCVLWPQTMWHSPIKRKFIFKWHERGNGCYARAGARSMAHLTDYRFMIYLCGKELSLLFELLLSTPHLFAFNPWSGKECGSWSAGRNPWPIPNLVNWSCQGHDPDCDKYPDCLNTLLRDPSGLSTAEQLRRISGAWGFHRFTNLVGGVRHVVVPSLMEFIRMAIRRALVDAMDPEFTEGGEPKLHENYIRRVNNLKVPEELKKYLIYEKMWYNFAQQHHMERNFRYLENLFENTPYESPTHGPGRIFANGFVPTKC